VGGVGEKGGGGEGRRGRGRGGGGGGGKKNVAKHMQLFSKFPSYAKTFNVFLHPIPSKNLILSATPFHQQPTTKPAGLKMC